MSFLRGVVAEFRQRRLWPVAVLLLAGLIAVPVLLAKQPSVPSVAPVPVAPASGKAVTVPVLNVTNGPSQAPLKGSARDPFTPQKQAQKPSPKTSTTAAATKQPAGTPATKTTASAPTTRGSSPASTAGNGNAAGSGGSSNGGSPSSSSSSTLSGAPPVALPTTPTVPTVSLHAPSVLSSTESYTVAVKLTGSGPARTIKSLQRDSVLPSVEDPMLIELGVLKGAKKVLFVVNPGTTLSGPGACTPGPIDCEVLAIPVGRTETLSVLAPGAVPATYHLTVNAVKAVHYPDATAALAGRRATVPAGRKMLAASQLSALTLFRYDPTQGAVIDQRNLTAGDS